MRYSIIGATYHQESLSVFYEGLENDHIDSFAEVLKRLDAVLLGELMGTDIPELTEMAQRIRQLPLTNKSDLNRLGQNVSERLQVTWVDDNHFVVDVMDSGEVYQLHLEIVPIAEADETI